MKRKSYERNRRLAGQTQQPIYKKRMSKMSVEITEGDFLSYVRIQKAGKFNMFDPRARDMTTLSKEQWVKCMSDYDKFYKAWVEDDKD
tara:strand:+ start:217 stop:480 length:264 start_codon:yes stop_codon:yes gene_type:complete